MTDTPPKVVQPEIKSPNHYKYQLKGILVHSGDADAGHYYSYIKENTRSEARWIEFNDRYVKDFNENVIFIRIF